MLGSDFELSELTLSLAPSTVASRSVPTIRLRRTTRRQLPVPARTEWIVRQHGGLSIAHGPWGFLLISYCGSVAWAQASTGVPGITGELFIARGPSISTSRFNHTVLHSFLPQWMALRGEVLLHATCVVADGLAFLFAGESTMGKSTLAAGFVAEGLDVFADDVVRVECRDGAAPQVWRSYPGVRLRGNSFLLPPAQRLRRVGRYGLPKHRIYPATGALQTSPAPVAAAFFLGRGRQVAARFEPLSPLQALTPFLRASFLQALPPATRSRDAFLRTTQLAAAIPAISLSYRRSPIHFQALLADILGYIRGKAMSAFSMGSGDRSWIKASTDAEAGMIR